MTQFIEKRMEDIEVFLSVFKPFYLHFASFLSYFCASKQGFSVKPRVALNVFTIIRHLYLGHSCLNDQVFLHASANFYPINKSEYYQFPHQ